MAATDPSGMASPSGADQPDDAADVTWLDALPPALLDRLAPFDAAAGDVLYEEGKPGHSFLLVQRGTADVVRDGTHLATIGAGSVIGELSLLTGDARSTTVIASSAMTGRRGTADDFTALLDVPEARDHLTTLAAKRLAANVVPVPFTTARGFAGELRPLLPGDRADYLDLLSRFSPESRRKRFFTSATPSASLVNYLLGIDYLNHFAWVALDTSHPHHIGAAVARCIRSEDHPDEAEVAFGVTDDNQSKGLGTVLLGAIGVTAEVIQVTTLTAEVLDDNTAMRRVFDKIGAHWARVDRGIVGARMRACDAAALLDPELADALRNSVHGIGAAAGAALHA